MKSKLLLVLIVLWGSLGVMLLSVAPGETVVAEEIDFPDPVGFVNDFANVLTIDDELEADLSQFAEEESTEIFVITTNELPEYTTIYDFVPRLTDANPMWRAGQEKYDNGVIFTIVMDTHEMAIDVGYGLEGALTDITATHILDYDVKPYFKGDDYDGGVRVGVESIKKAVAGEYEAEAATTSEEDAEVGAFMIQGLVCGGVLLFIVVPYLAAFLGRTKSWWVGGIVGFVISIILSVWVAFFDFFGMFRYMGICIFGPVFTLLGLLFDYILSKNYKVRKKKKLPTSFFRSLGGFSSGRSSFGSSFSSGSSSGGFSGGSGGSFGGGGGRSSW